MNSTIHVRRFISLGLLAILVLILQSQQSVYGMVAADALVADSFPGQYAYIYYAPGTKGLQNVPPPVSYLQSEATAVRANIQVNYNGGGWTTEATTAFEYAVGIWETQIVSNVTIEVDAEFASLGTGVLGGAGTTTIHRNFSGVPMANTWYPSALANALSGSDLNASTAEIDAAFNSNINIPGIDWYYGIDGNTPNNRIDFVSVVLHEIGHGLGFFGSMTISGGQGSWGFSGDPIIYDRFAENGSGQPLISAFPNGSAALAAQLTGGNIFFNGTNTNVANGGSRAELYAPGSWAQGSSYSHLDEVFNGTPNALMTYSLDDGEAQHDPGLVTLGVFEDLGWTTNTAPPEPVISTLPNQLLVIGTNKDNAIDLWVYTSDSTSNNSELTYTVTNQSDPIANATVDSNRYVDINPTNPSWSGSSTVTIQVEDPDMNTTTATFTIYAVNEIFPTYLPIVINN